MHGGDIYNNEIEYDFSVNVNPFAPYEEVVKVVESSLSKLSAYPEYNSVSLREKIADCFCLSHNNVCVTNGASEAILSLVRNLKSENVYIETPSFFGYERALLSDQILHSYNRKSLLKLDENTIINGSTIIIANPANPTGYYADNSDLIALYEKIKKANGYLVVDESFLPLCDFNSNTIINEIKKNKAYYDRLIVIRSFTKSFSIAAIRLGYFICTNEDIVRYIEKSIPEWSVSIPAQVAGIECLNLIDRLTVDAKRIREERIKLKEALNQIGLITNDSCANYILFIAPKAIYENLLKKKILIRDCSNYRGIDEIKQELIGRKSSLDNSFPYGSDTVVFRVSVKTEKENNVLIAAIKEVLKEYA